MVRRWRVWFWRIVPHGHVPEMFWIDACTADLLCSRCHRELRWRNP